MGEGGSCANTVKVLSCCSGNPHKVRVVPQEGVPAAADAVRGEEGEDLLHPVWYLGVFVARCGT